MLVFFQVEENVPRNTSVGEFSVVDPDNEQDAKRQTFTFKLSDTSTFALQGSTLRVRNLSMFSLNDISWNQQQLRAFYLTINSGLRNDPVIIPLSLIRLLCPFFLQQLKSDLNFEKKSSYPLRVLVTDSGTPPMKKTFDIEVRQWW